jgi:hypothetical protein
MPFSQAGRIGYFRVSGEGILSMEALGDAVAADFAFARRSGPGNDQENPIVFSSPDGRTLFELEGPGYPILGKGRFLVASDDDQALAEYDVSGRLLWRRAFPSIMTALDIGAEALAIGCLDGSVIVLDGQGRELHRSRPGGSRIQAVYGLALSADAERLALVSGIDPQRFQVLERKRGLYKVIFHAALESDFRRAVLVEFSAGGRDVFFEQAGGLGVYELKRSRVRVIPVLGRIQAMGADQSDGPIAFLTDSGRGLVLSLHEPAGVPRLASVFSAETGGLKQDGQRVIVSVGHLIARLDAREE